MINVSVGQKKQRSGRGMFESCCWFFDQLAGLSRTDIECLLLLSCFRFEEMCGDAEKIIPINYYILFVFF